MAFAKKVVVPTLPSVRQYTGYFLQGGAFMVLLSIRFKVRY